MDIIHELLHVIIPFVDEEMVLHEALQTLITLTNSPKATPDLKQSLARWGTMEVLHYVLDKATGKAVKVWGPCCHAQSRATCFYGSQLRVHRQKPTTPRGWVGT
jgi:hypothetical protein